MALSADERYGIEEELIKTKAMASKVVETIAFVKNAMARVQDQSYETMAEIRSAADRMILEVRAREERLIKKVAEILDWKEESLQQQKKGLEDFLGELQQSIDYTSDTLNKPDHEIDEWKTALSAQLKSLQNMEDEYICEPHVGDGMGFVFLYENEQLLDSIANYGTVIDNVKSEDNYDKKEGKGMPGIRIIPVITLNGVIVNLVEVEKKNCMDKDSDSSDDEGDESDESDDEESETGFSDDDHDPHGDNDDDDGGGGDDSNNKQQSKNGHKTLHNSNDNNARLRKSDKVSDGIEKPKVKCYSNQPNLDKTMTSPNKANKVQKLSTLL